MISTIWRWRAGQRPGDAVTEQLGAFAHRRQRGLQLVRNAAQEAVLLVLELGEPAAQPVEAVAEGAQVGRTGHVDRLREVAAPELADGGIERADRLGDDAREHDRQRQRRGRAEQREQHRPLLQAGGFLRAAPPPRRSTTSWLAAMTRRVLSTSAPTSASSSARSTLLARRRRQHARASEVSSAIARSERGARPLAQLETAQLDRDLAKAAVRADEILEQRRVAEHRGLLREPVDRAEPVEQRAAGARGVHRVVERALAAHRELLGAPGGVDERRATAAATPARARPAAGGRTSAGSRAASLRRAAVAHERGGVVRWRCVRLRVGDSVAVERRLPFRRGGGGHCAGPDVARRGRPLACAPVCGPAADVGGSRCFHEESVSAAGTVCPSGESMRRPVVACTIGRLLRLSCQAT